MKLASYETITEILPIEGADKIQLARIQGWQSVIKKDEYKVGEQVIFVPIDTVIQPAEWNKFLWDKNDPNKPIRVKTIKLRGVISQGIIFPTTLINAQEIFDHMDDADEDVSIAGMLGITKYEKPIPAKLAGDALGNFPSHLLSKTDEDNLCSNIQVLEELKNVDIVEASIKYDGTSVTYIYNDDKFLVCSRNLELKDGDTVYWNIARKYKIEILLKQLHQKYGNVAIQGEIYGNGIQGNPLKIPDVQFTMFNFKLLDSNTYLHLDDIYLLENENITKYIPTVKVLYAWNKLEFSDFNISSLQEITNKQYYTQNNPAEGLVFRGYNIVNNKKNLVYSTKLCKMLSVKIINQHYKD